MPDATVFRRAVELLYPGLSTRAAAAALWRLAGQRSTVEAMRQHLLGPRPIPRWIRDIVAAELKRRAYTYQQSESDVATLTCGPGRGDVTRLRAGWQKKRAAEAALKSYPQEN